MYLGLSNVRMEPACRSMEHDFSFRMQRDWEREREVDVSKGERWRNPNLNVCSSLMMYSIEQVDDEITTSMCINDGTRTRTTVMISAALIHTS